MHNMLQNKKIIFFSIIYDLNLKRTIYDLKLKKKKSNFH